MPELVSQSVLVIGIATLVAAIGAIVKVSRWGGKVDSRLESLEKAMAEVRENISKILDRLPSTVGRASPLKLTELGREISAELGGAAWARATAPALQGRVAGMDPYRIQEFSRAYVQDGPEADWAPDSEMAAKLGQCAFDHGLKMEQVLDVLAIELRDQLLELTGREPPG